MQYGHFSKDGSEYIITRFDIPRPWLNVIYNDSYGLYISQNAFGYSFYRDSLDVRINYADVFGYVPTHPQSGKFIYLRDLDTGRTWANVPIHSAKGYSACRCVHGQGYTRITARRNGIETEFLALVPPGDEPVEIWSVTLRNTTGRPRRIKAFPYQQWQLTAPTGITDTLTYTRAAYRPDLAAIVARMTNPTSPFMYDAFMAADFQPDEFDCKYDAFIGTYGRLDEPAAVTAGSATNSSASGERMCGALAKTFTLPPHGDAHLLVLTGVAGAAPPAQSSVERSDADIRRLKEKYLSPGAAQAALDAVRTFWQSIRNTLTTRTPDPTVNLMANTWVKWQNHFAARHARSGYRGFRDILQDTMGLTPLDPQYTRDWLLETLRRQYRNGLCIRGWNPVSGRVDSRLHRDSPCWIPLTLSACLRETGDDALLDRPVEYLDGGAGTVIEHALAGMRRLGEERAPNGLCLIGDGDWNDSLNEVALDGNGQSVWLTIAAVHAMHTLEDIARFARRTSEADELRRTADELAAAANAHGWDGDWYLYALTGRGEPVGSHTNREGQIHLNVQTWAIFSGVAPPDRILKLLDLIDNRLDTEFGPVLIHPAYTGYVRGIGKVSGKNPGQAENGPIYSHGVAFKMLADLHLGRGARAVESYLKTCAASPDKDPDRFLGEPFAAHRYIIGPSCPERFGASPYSGNTAWPAWTFQLLFERILGVQPWYDGLRIDPCIPAAWERYEVVRPFRGATYRITVRNPGHVERGIRDIRLDGHKHNSNLLPAFSDGLEHRVLVTMGQSEQSPR